MKQGKRRNDGKPRLDLIPGFSMEQMAKVFTFGAEKYGDHNWRTGMDWSKIIASADRHLNAIKSGEDYDPESGLLHSAHVMANMAFLTEYYKSCPFFDDRYRQMPLKIALDIDEVLADFCHQYAQRYPDVDPRPTTWFFDPLIKERLEQLVSDHSFWAKIPILNHIRFEPHCYITARPSELSDVTIEWLTRNGFPPAPLYCVGFGESKTDAFIQSGADIMVDDSVNNFLDFREMKLPVLLFSAPHNQRFNAGVLRVTMDQLNTQNFFKDATI